MLTVDKRVLDPVDVHQYVTEASDARFPVGPWPQTFEVPGLGNGLPFVVVEATPTDVLYRQQLGIVLIRVWND